MGIVDQEGRVAKSRLKHSGEGPLGTRLVLENGVAGEGEPGRGPSGKDFHGNRFGLGFLGVFQSSGDEQQRFQDRIDLVLGAQFLLVLPHEGGESKGPFDGAEANIAQENEKESHTVASAQSQNPLSRVQGAMKISLTQMTQKVLNLELPETVEGGKRYQAKVRLSAPSPQGGAKVILLPAHRLELPDAVVIPEGESEFSFTFLALKGPSRRPMYSGDLTVSTVFKGKVVKWDGPRRAKAKLLYD